jgi:hypothetical protein
MGTNYYVTTQACPTCGVSKYDNLHLGKSSMGWTFALHVYPEMHLATIKEWMALLAQPGTKIIDEYDKCISFEHMVEIIFARHRDPLSDADARLQGYDSANHFYERNGAVIGPNGLIRAKVDGVHCIGHGSGTFDYHVGDFS